MFSKSFTILQVPNKEAIPQEEEGQGPRKSKAVKHVTIAGTDSGDPQIRSENWALKRPEAGTEGAAQVGTERQSLQRSSSWSEAPSSRISVSSQSYASQERNGTDDEDAVGGPPPPDGIRRKIWKYRRNARRASKRAAEQYHAMSQRAAQVDATFTAFVQRVYHR